jgi:hypothetical protein
VFPGKLEADTFNGGGLFQARRFAIAPIPKKPHFMAMNHSAANQPLF